MFGTKQQLRLAGKGRQAFGPAPAACRRRSARSVVVRATASSNLNENLGFQTMRDGVKVAAAESLLTPRFYTTDFAEMEELFSDQINPNLDMAELESCLQEFRNDYNKTHFVRNETFKAAADKVTGPTRKIFIEFLERSCTAEFSGFLLYKELARRLKTSSPKVAEMFLLMSRDEARHAGFINKALSDFNLALDLGFLTKNRTYTYFKPKFIIYATFLSEKIGYWRYISIYRHLQRNPDNQFYPLFEYFENWCQDENRHGDFLAACLKARPELLDTFEAKLWSKFFCLSVYITMYLNDHQRTKFYESLGLTTRQFNQHVIIETNKSTERLFPVVPDVEDPWFFEQLNRMVDVNTKLASLDADTNMPAFFKTLAKLPFQERLAAYVIQMLFCKDKQVGSVDIDGSAASQRLAF
ncbi:Magnesium-protoporphyrin IX monomethyl ester [oxidative] cyclase 1, chloroplastic [Tetrabaena socialis]|uniref:magnesium-protoporphyrin IX monomethyl ester (oxidative) cyclase n=1 Tax=Tetrabaena socialis TaxID=47790 RepID=A0A2J8A0U5_9CHLO|nr:Magnesium-protoporphyrin IX monomethyl ester [oxidative] cyclase 1, chloroplastic [Tetrabaena socialis]|eukprot:PNH06134.1 Magnesium-protoporphyrin IX monomethyl ester [oxidative] cyclase 1, chloroplastic [Tetrabaena socialis]